MRLIDADVLSHRMYIAACEADSDMQKWDSGCWIRYMLFQNILDEQPTIETKPCYDLISRQAAIDALRDGALLNYQAAGHHNGLVKAIDVIRGLPPATPKEV